MNRPVIARTGVHQPPESISNQSSTPRKSNARCRTRSTKVRSLFKRVRTFNPYTKLKIHRYGQRERIPPPCGGGIRRESPEVIGGIGIGLRRHPPHRGSDADRRPSVQKNLHPTTRDIERQGEGWVANRPVIARTGVRRGAPGSWRRQWSEPQRSSASWNPWSVPPISPLAARQSRCSEVVAR